MINIVTVEDAVGLVLDAVEGVVDLGEHGVFVLRETAADGEQV